MNKEAIQEINAKLSGTSMTPQERERRQQQASRQELLEKLRITPEKVLEPMDFLFRLFGKPCFPRRELVAITGKAKSGKTLVISMLMACCITQKVLALERLTEIKGHSDLADLTDLKPLRVLWYDTEQSDESTQDILKNRILKMTGHTDLTDHTDKMLDLWSQEESVESVKSVCDYIDVFNVRSVEWKLRRALLTEAVKRCNPDLVIVDGIRDLVNDINDGVLAQEVMEELMQLSGIVIPFKYNQLLHQALEQNIIGKLQRNGLTVYQPAPF